MNSGQGSAATESAIMVWAAQRRLPRASLEKWLAFGGPERLALLEVARGLRFRTGQLAAALELLEEIALRESGRGSIRSWPATICAESSGGRDRRRAAPVRCSIGCARCATRGSLRTWTSLTRWSRRRACR